MIHKEVIAYEIYAAGIGTRHNFPHGFYHEGNVAARQVKRATTLNNCYFG